MTVSERIDEFIQSVCTRRMIPGLSLTVVEEGIVTKMQGYGFANVEHAVPATPDTVYNAGSIGKQFVATAIMQLAEDGLLQVDDPISQHLGVAPEQWRGMTIRHLLTHTAGLQGDFPPNDLDPRVNYSDDELVSIIAQLPLLFMPGEGWRYGGLGYLLLGILIAKATGKFYSDFLQERVFAPLGMTTARVKSETEIIPHRASGYLLTEHGMIHCPHIPAATRSLRCSPSGTLIFTVKDLVAWDAGLYAAKVLSPASLQAMWSPTRLNNGQTYDYGFGWECNKVNGYRIVEHGGQGVGTSSHIARYLDQRLTVIVLTNRNRVNAGWIAHTVAGMVNATVAPVTPEPVALTAGGLAAYTGRYRLDENSFVTFKCEGSQLILQSLMHGGDFPLLPLSDTAFFASELETHFTFVKNEQGQVVQCLVLEDNNFPLVKVE